MPSIYSLPFSDQIRWLGSIAVNLYNFAKNGQAFSGQPLPSEVRDRLIEPLPTTWEELILYSIDIVNILLVKMMFFAFANPLTMIAAFWAVFETIRMFKKVRYWISEHRRQSRNELRS